MHMNKNNDEKFFLNNLRDTNMKTLSWIADAFRDLHHSDQAI